jgi:hypothetical protein
MKNIFMNLALICLVFCFTGNLMAQNTPPEVTRIDILPSNPTLDDDITCDYDYFDADGDTEDVDQRTVYWKRNGIYQSQFRNQLTLPASATGNNELWEVELRVHDGTDQSEMATASVSFGAPEPNTRPEARDVQILPNNPTTSDDLNLSYTYYDAEGDPEDVSQRTIYWQRNGEWVTAYRHQLTIPSSATQKGETWQCALEVHDGKDKSSQVWSDPITIINSPPVATDLLITPSNPNVDDALIASYTYSDVDDDPQSGTEIRWYKDSVLQPDYNDQLSIPASATSGGEEWYFTVRPSDGVDFGDLQTSPIVTITSIVPDNTPPEAQDVHILPSNPTSSDDLTAHYTYYDSDGDPEDVSQRETAWQKDGEFTYIHAGLLTVPASDTKKGETWRMYVKVSDGQDLSPAVWTDPVTIGNTSPEATDLSLTPTKPDRNDALVANYTYSDIDDDPEDGTEIRWYKDTILQPDYNDQLSVPASATSGGEEWYFTVHPRDGEDFGELQTSSTVTITTITYSLSISVEPEGTGTTDPPVGVSTYEEGLDVTITAIPAEGCQFVNWTGNVADPNSPSTTVTMSEDQEVTAHFEIITYELQIAVSPAAGGTTDPEEGVHTYEAGEDVIIEAIPAEGYRFVDWTGNVAHGIRPLTYVTLSSNQSVTANFESIPTYTLTMQVSPQGSGTTEPSVGNHTFYERTDVNITATPVNGYEFVNWTGDVAEPNDPTTTLTINTDEVVTANFRTTQEIISTPIVPVGPDSGYKMQPLEFTTGGSVSNKDHEVEYQFDWGDGKNSGFTEYSSRQYAWSKTGTFYVRARARSAINTNVISQWSESTQIAILPCTINITVTPPEAGSVRRNPDTSEYDYEQEVTLTATPSSNMYVFDHWSGDLSGTNNPETLTMKGEHNVTAHFRMINEVVSAPDTVDGPSTGFKKQNLTFTTQGSSSNFGHDVEYQFDWDDGSLSDWGIALKSHAYSDTGIYHVKSRARCKLHTNVMSGWSMTHAVTISACSLTISINPSGAGSVIKDPDKSGYDYGDTITMTATPVTGWKFTGWSGDHGGNNNPAIISIRNNMSITANFEQQTYTLTIHVTPSGTGNIIKSPDKSKYSHGEVVVCTAIANPDSFYKFDHWSGDISDTVKSVSLIMDKNKNITAHFSSSVTSVSDLDSYGIIPSEYILMQNYPNPFNPETIIRYQIPKSSHIKLEVFNILGERIRTLVDAEQNAGYYQVVWNGKDDMGVIVPSGIYFYVLRYNNTVSYKKAIFLK